MEVVVVVEVVASGLGLGLGGCVDFSEEVMVGVALLLTSASDMAAVVNGAEVSDGTALAPLIYSLRMRKDSRRSE